MNLHNSGVGMGMYDSEYQALPLGSTLRNQLPGGNPLKLGNNYGQEAVWHENDAGKWFNHGSLIDRKYVAGVFFHCPSWMRDQSRTVDGIYGYGSAAKVNFVKTTGVWEGFIATNYMYRGAWRQQPGTDPALPLKRESISPMMGLMVDAFDQPAKWGTPVHGSGYNLLRADASTTFYADGNLAIAGLNPNNIWGQTRGASGGYPACNTKPETVWETYFDK
jgi:hypothetical protein